MHRTMSAALHSFNQSFERNNPETKDSKTTQLDSQLWPSIEEKENEPCEHDQIPFMDFSFFPVAEIVSSLSKIDWELDNFGNVAEELVTNHLKPNNSAETKFTDAFIPVETESYPIGNRSIILDAETDVCSIPPISDLDPKLDDFEFPSFQTDIIEKKDGNRNRFKPKHEEKWNHRFKEFLEFVKENGHAAVPIVYPKNPKLAHWVKRQRQQYKLRQELQTSTMTTERIELLSSVGFVWDSQDANWGMKLDALKEFHRRNGHCNVPRKFKENSLGVWVKVQRRQYKLYKEGKPSHMTSYRVEELEKLGFDI